MAVYAAGGAVVMIAVPVARPDLSLVNSCRESQWQACADEWAVLGWLARVPLKLIYCYHDRKRTQRRRASVRSGEHVEGGGGKAAV